jgi:hypothetical protein
MNEPSTIQSGDDFLHQTPRSATGPGAKTRPRDLFRILVLIVALGAVVLGLLGGSFGFLLSLLTHDTGSLSIATFSLSILILATGLGLVLAWHTWHAIRGVPSPVFRPRRIGLLILLFPLSLVLGQSVLALDLLPLITFPLFHVTATILPAVIIISLVSRGLGAMTSRRDVAFQVSSGAFLSAPLAFALEAIALLSILVAVVIGLSVRPGGTELIQGLTTALQNPTLLQDLSFLAPALNSPAIMAFAGVFVVGIVPLIEEGVKAVGVGLRAYRKPTLPQAFLWGLAGGAGFAIVEGLLNTAGGWEAWAPIVLLRVGATLLHCFTGALMGIAWYNVLAKQRWSHGLGLYASSVAIHGLWNALSIGMALLSLSQPATDLTADNQAVAGLRFGIILVLLATLALVRALSLLGLTLFLRKRSLTDQLSEIHPPDPIPKQPSPPTA